MTDDKDAGVTELEGAPRPVVAVATDIAVESTTQCSVIRISRCHHLFGGLRGRDVSRRGIGAACRGRPALRTESLVLVETSDTHSRVVSLGVVTAVLVKFQILGGVLSAKDVTTSTAVVATIEEREGLVAYRSVTNSSLSVGLPISL